MTRPYSMDLRERMVRAVKAGASRRATAARFGVSPSCVIKLVQRWRGAGTLAPEPVRGGRRAKLAEHAERVQVLLAAAPDSTRAELQARLAAAARRAWRAQQPALSPKRLVFIDETWATTAMARRYGRARRGQRLVAAAPQAASRKACRISGRRRL